MLDIIEERHSKRVTIITSQVPVKNGTKSLEKTLADAILDQIAHQSLQIELCEDLLLKKQKGEIEI